METKIIVNSTLTTTSCNKTLQIKNVSHRLLLKKYGKQKERMDDRSNYDSERGLVRGLVVERGLVVDVSSIWINKKKKKSLVKCHIFCS